MPWYMWVLIYVAGWMATFRVIYLQRREVTQRAIASGRHREVARKALEDADWVVDKWTQSDWLISSTAASLWPFVLLYHLLKFIMFPRGIRTRFDREQKILAEKDEAEIKYKEARALLAKEGIKVE